MCIYIFIYLFYAAPRCGGQVLSAENAGARAGVPKRHANSAEKKNARARARPAGKKKCARADAAGGFRGVPKARKFRVPQKNNKSHKEECRGTIIKTTMFIFYSFFIFVKYRG